MHSLKRRCIFVPINVITNINKMKTIDLGQGYFAKVDDDVFEKINNKKWYVLKREKHTSYAVCKVKTDNGWINLSMHTLIMGLKKGKEIDHIDGDGLNNQKDNLRFCTRSENNRNRKPYGKSKYKGVVIYTQKRKYTKQNGEVSLYISEPRFRAQINVNGKIVFLGQFKTEKEAAEAYNKAAKENYGENTQLNNL